jgi:hypothetical protein
LTSVSVSASTPTTSIPAANSASVIGNAFIFVAVCLQLIL